MAYGAHSSGMAYGDHHRTEGRLRVGTISQSRVAEKSIAYYSTPGDRHTLLVADAEPDAWVCTSAQLARLGSPAELRRLGLGMRERTEDELDLSNLSLGRSGAEQLAGRLKAGVRITKLELANCSIGDAGAKALAPALRHNATITFLSLRGNAIGDDGAKKLAHALGVISADPFEGVSDGEDGDGVRATGGGVQRAVHHNHTLTTLDLRNNHVRDEGATELAKALRANSTLRSLALGGNGIGEPGAIDLAGAIRANQTLTELDLTFNLLGSKGAGELAKGANEVVETDVQGRRRTTGKWVHRRPGTGVNLTLKLKGARSDFRDVQGGKGDVAGVQGGRGA